MREMASIKLERKSSIELEPRTLSFRELQLARESAISILKNNSLEEAIKIFTDGLQQSVPRIEENSRLNDFSYVDSEEEEDEDQMIVYYSFRPQID